MGTALAYCLQARHPAGVRFPGILRSEPGFGASGVARLERAWVVRFVKMHCGENGRRRWLVRVGHTQNTDVPLPVAPGNARDCLFESGQCTVGQPEPYVNRR